MELARHPPLNEHDGQLDEQEQGKESGQAVEPRRSNSRIAAEAAAVRRQRGAGIVLPPSPVALYEARLGQLLGPKLYNAISDLITLEKLASYARSGLESGLGSLGETMKDIDPTDSAAIDRAITAMRENFGPKAEAYVEAHGGAFQQSLQGFVDANPTAIVLIACLAAAGAVAADMSLPELKHTFRVTDQVGIELGAKLGSLRNIAVERISARVELASGPLKASAGATYEPETERFGASLGLDYALSDDFDLYARGSWREGIENGGRIDPTETSLRAGMRWNPRKNMSIEGYGEMDEERGAGAGISFNWSF